MLHVAPEPCLARVFQGIPSVIYLSADLKDRRAMVQIDITEIPYPASSFDVIYCRHVLEHIPNDRRAMRELHRVLTPSGWALFMVPITAPITYEDFTISDRKSHETAFGQSDHVRRYGPDFEHRLSESGFEVRRIDPSEVVSISELKRYAFNIVDYIFFCRKTLR
jgi:ubiquinone/menaquinone biosynthesis C-methylase UbiE